MFKGKKSMTTLVKVCFWVALGVVAVIGTNSLVKTDPSPTAYSLNSTEDGTESTFLSLDSNEIRNIGTYAGLWIFGGLTCCVLFKRKPAE